MEASSPLPMLLLPSRSSTERQPQTLAAAHETDGIEPILDSDSDRTADLYGTVIGLATSQTDPPGLSGTGSGTDAYMSGASPLQLPESIATQPASAQPAPGMADAGPRAGAWTATWVWAHTSGDTEAASVVVTPLVPLLLPSPAYIYAGELGVEDSALMSASQQVDEADRRRHPDLSDLPNEVLMQILGYLDVCDLLSTSRISHHFRRLSVAPILHNYRLRRTRAILPPMLTSPFRPSLADLIARHIFLTHTTVVSRKLARSLVSIRLSRRLAVRPSPELLVERCVLPPECVPGKEQVAPALVAKRRAVERERVKDGLRRWVGSVWKGEVRNREDTVKRWEERVGVGRVWRLRRFWERVGNGESQAST